MEEIVFPEKNVQAVDDVDREQDEEGGTSELVHDDPRHDPRAKVGQAHQAEKVGGVCFVNSKTDGSFGEECEDRVNTEIQEKGVRDEEELGGRLDD